jgi:hypothetical protein
MVACIASSTVMQLARNQPIYTQLLHRTINFHGENKKQIKTD